MEEHLIDIRDLDTEYFLCVRVWLDRASDRLYLPRESAERVGEPDEDGNFLLLDGAVIAEAETIEVNGVKTPAWSVPVGLLVTRPAR